MEFDEFSCRLEGCIAKYDLLCHPFYQAWSRGVLTREDLQDYAIDYYHHVESFPRALADFARRLPQSELRQAVLNNLGDELGSRDEPSHADLWCDFAEGVGTGQVSLDEDHPSPQMKNLIHFFRAVAKEGTPEQALAAFYAYESQVPRVSREKARGLREMYRANERTCQYFIVHTTADVYHANVWREQLLKRLQANLSAVEVALKSAETAARLLWEALDGIENTCLERIARTVPTRRLYQPGDATL